MTVRIGIHPVLHSISNIQDVVLIIHYPLQGYFTVRPNVVVINFLCDLKSP